MPLFSKNKRKCSQQRIVLPVSVSFNSFISRILSGLIKCLYVLPMTFISIPTSVFPTTILASGCCDFKLSNSFKLAGWCHVEFSPTNFSDAFSTESFCNVTKSKYHVSYHVADKASPKIPTTDWDGAATTWTEDRQRQALEKHRNGSKP